MTIFNILVSLEAKKMSVKTLFFNFANFWHVKFEIFPILHSWFYCKAVCTNSELKDYNGSLNFFSGGGV